jgi:hypothetical protein
MGNEPVTWIECPCQYCLSPVPFQRSEAGQSITCPSCGMPTVVFDSSISTQIPPLTVPQRDSSPPRPESPFQLPKLTDESLRSIEVRSSDGERFYTVNLIDYTCTCPSFMEVHQMAPERDFGRLCKHMCLCLSRPETLPLLNPACLAMVSEGFGIYPGRVDRDDNGNPIYITGTNTNGWLNVFALKRKAGRTYYRFGYNVNERRWAYGSKPKISEETLYPKQLRDTLPATSARIPNDGAGSRFGQILRSVLTGLGRGCVLLAQIMAYICVAVLAGFVASGSKSRRRRRF